MKFVSTLMSMIFVVILVAAVLAAYLLLTPFGPTTETFVDLPPGAGTEGTAILLRQAHIIRSRFAFEALRFSLRVVRGGTLHAGEYRFDHPVPMTQVYSRLVRGDIYTRALVIPEGYNIFDIARAVDAAGLGSRDTFLAAERQHTELIAEWSPHAISLEGYLFPATYRFSRHATPDQMLTSMVRRFRQAATQLGLRQDAGSTVITASLIEKEVSQEAERPLVAGVFANRLAQGMPLETDPAVVYAALLDGRYRGTIYRSDLESPSPYNTYRHTGLPPGPICNPGLAAFRAALHPTKTDLLYFVSDGAGHTRFSAGLKEHQQQVDAYRNAVKGP